MSGTSSSTCDPLDPSDDRRIGQQGGEAPIPVVQILFHSDLDRIGDIATPDPDNWQAGVTFGRDSPLFYDANGAGACLADPCVSREQLRLTQREQGLFALTVPPSSRRSVAAWTLTGEQLPTTHALPARTVITVGDRVMLLLQRLPAAVLAADRLGLVGESAALWLVRGQVSSVARSRSNVLIYGESGVGKELVAKGIHAASRQRAGRFVALNCAAIPAALLESELFGHVKGAFTGATADKEGFFAAARNGTLFLDEVGELPLELQAKLLRVLQEWAFAPLGSASPQPLRARVVAATNHDLREATRTGRFRADLYYRLATLAIAVPPLREHREDIPQIATFLLQEAAASHCELRRLFQPVSQRATPVALSLFERLMHYHWPGNVRHLRNAIERIALASLGVLGMMLPPDLLAELSEPATAPPGGEGGPVPRSSAGQQLDRHQLLQVLEQFDYVQHRVAQELGVSHSTVDRWMRELGLRRARDLTRHELQQLASELGHDIAAMARRLRVSRRGLALRLHGLGIEPRDD